MVYNFNNFINFGSSFFSPRDVLKRNFWKEELKIAEIKNLQKYNSELFTARSFIVKEKGCCRLISVKIQRKVFGYRPLVLEKKKCIEFFGFWWRKLKIGWDKSGVGESEVDENVEFKGIKEI